MTSVPCRLSDACCIPGQVRRRSCRRRRDLLLAWTGTAQLFNGRTWTGNDSAMGSRGARCARTSRQQRANRLNYEITLEPTRQPWVFALDMPWEWDLLDNTFRWGMQQQLARNRAQSTSDSHTRAVSYPRYLDWIRTDVELTDFARRVLFAPCRTATNEETLRVCRPACVPSPAHRCRVHSRRC